MKQRHLRILRVITSVTFLLLILFLFVDFHESVSPEWMDRILFLQFVPSVIRFLTIPALAAGGFFFIVLLTAFFGRVYCSAFCPLGVLQDIFTWISKKTHLIKRFRFTKAIDYLRYPLLVLVLIPAISGSLFVLNLFDPYSSFGRIFSDLVRPGVYLLNNALAGILEKFDFYFIYRLNIQLITWHTVWIPIITLVLVVWLSLFFGRFYCNAICPVGTFLGLLSRKSLLTLKMNPVTCTKCSKCSFVCKSSCIDVKNLKIDFSRCVACYDCITECPERSIAYAWSLHARRQPDPVNGSKRELFRKTWIYGLTLAGISTRGYAVVKTDRPAGRIPNKKSHPVSPPGSVSLKHFTDRCTACHLCVTACPTGVLQPSYLEYGFTGMMQPHMNYLVEYCNFECTICGEICPTGAILPLTTEDKKLEQTGQVTFILEKCIVYTDNTACGSCSEHCPTQAVRMIPYQGKLTIPETNKEICIGCGACEFACPVKPHASIFVDGHAVHQVARKPVIEELKDESKEEFPF